MTLFELTRRNVARNFRLYTIYLVAMIVSVMIYFTFVSLTYNDTILSTLTYSDTFKLGMTIASTVTLVFIAVFVFYANGFFIRNRKREIGMYLVLGMREGQVGRMIFYENLWIGALSLVVGGAFGWLLSRLFTGIVLRLMVYHVPIRFTFSFEAAGQTIAVFLVLTLLVSLQARWIIRRVKLRELFQAAQRAERPVKTSPPLAILSLLLVGAAYACIAQGWGSKLWTDYSTAAMLVCAVGIVGGTYLLFRQFAGSALGLLARRRRYVESPRMLWLSEIRFQVRGNAANLTFIALFSTMLLFFVAFVVINYKVQFTAVAHNLPNTFAYASVDERTQSEIDAAIASSGFGIRYRETVETIAAEPVSPMEEAFENAEYFLPAPSLVAESAYNRILSLRGHEEPMVDLDGTEAISLSQGLDESALSMPGYDPSPFEVKVGDTALTLALVDRLNYALLGWQSGPGVGMFGKAPLLVVSDELYGEIAAAQEGAKQAYMLYQLDDAERTLELSKTLYALAHGEGRYFSSYADVYAAQIESSSALLFGSCFLAFIALFAMASVIYFKQMREATDARPRYAILRKLGVAERTIRSLVRKQLLFVFLPALAVGIAHSGIILNYYILDALQDYDMRGTIAAVLGMYAGIYALFYWSAVRVYRAIIAEG